MVENGDFVSLSLPYLSQAGQPFVELGVQIGISVAVIIFHFSWEAFVEEIFYALRSKLGPYFVNLNRRPSTALVRHLREIARFYTNVCIKLLCLAPVQPRGKCTGFVVVKVCNVVAGLSFHNLALLSTSTKVRLFGKRRQTKSWL